MKTTGWWIAALGLVACTSSGGVEELAGEDVIAVEDTRGDLMADLALDCGTFIDNTCGDGLYCAGPPVCGAVWSCQEEHPCSAAPPYLACGCDGQVRYVAAGCTERHAWSFGALPGDASLDGAACDATARDPLVLDLEVRGQGGPEGVSILTLIWGGYPERGPVEVAVTREGTFEGRLEDVERDPGRGFGVVIFGDVDGDGACTDGVDLVAVASPGMFDPLALELSAVVDLGAASAGSCVSVVP